MDRMDLMAQSYDRYAPLLVPYYEEMQAVLLDRLRRAPAVRLVVDLGAGTGRLLELVCRRFPEVHAVWVDRSPAMRAVAEERLKPFGDRVTFIQAALESPWERALPARPTHILSMSAIHHLVDREKARLYGRCYRLLPKGGAFWNADEVRAPALAAYYRALREWDRHVSRLIAAHKLDEIMVTIWQAWRRRNLGPPRLRRPGDDCHATVEAQLAMLRRAGFVQPQVIWQRGLWCVFGASR